MKYLLLKFGFAAAALVSLPTSAANAACTRPSGQYVGQGAGAVFYQGSTLLGGRNEVWSLIFPSDTVQGSIFIRARSHPRPDEKGDWYSLYTLPNTPVDILHTEPASFGLNTWNAVTCSGMLWVRGNANMRWTTSKGVAPPQTEPAEVYQMNSAYIYTSTHDGNTVTFTMVGQGGPFAPNFSVLLERP